LNCPSPYKREIYGFEGGDPLAFVITEDCVACGTCADECESNAIEEGKDIYVINEEKCTECGTCVEVCPTEAIVEK
jgi:ferredoxin